MITLGELKEVLNIPEDDTTEDTYLAQCEAAAVEHVAGRTGLHLGAPAPTTLYLSGTRGSLWLPQDAADTPAPIIEIRSGSTWETVDADDYEIDGVEIYAPDGWTEGVRNYRITFTRGWNSGDEPADLRQVVIWFAVHCFLERSPVVTGTIATALPLHFEKVLKRYGRGVKL